MKLQTFCYTSQAGWSVTPLPALDGEQTLVLAFGASSLFDAPGPIRELARLYPRAQLLGCSTAGEIYGTTVSDESLVVAVAQFQHTHLVNAVATVHTVSESYAAGEAIARKLHQPALKGVLLFSDGLNVNGSELVRGLNAVLPSSVVVTGGLAGDGDRFLRTWVIKDGSPHSGFVCAVGLYGDRITIGHGSKGGWDIFGPERRVTRAHGNILYELDGKPALQLYKEYLGDRAVEMPATALLFPLAFRTPAPLQRHIVRTILAVDETTQSLVFAGDIPQGSWAQLMRATFDRVIGAAGEAAFLTRATGGAAADALTIAVSCVGRRLMLGERAEEELEATLEGLPNGIRQIGFYSYGEIGPYASGVCELHNQTMTLTTISEG